MNSPAVVRNIWEGSYVASNQDLNKVAVKGVYDTL